MANRPQPDVSIPATAVFESLGEPIEPIIEDVDIIGVERDGFLQVRRASGAVVHLGGKGIYGRLIPEDREQLRSYVAAKWAMSEFDESHRMLRPVEELNYGQFIDRIREQLRALKRQARTAERERIKADRRASQFAKRPKRSIRLRD